jgi:hypothetical protein
MIKKDKLLTAAYVTLIVCNILLLGIKIGRDIEESKHTNINENAAITIARETEENATVIIRTEDGNVYEFSGNNYDIADNRVTVFFE